MNAPSSRMYPEKCNYLIERYGPEDDIVSAKRKNLPAFQKKTGLREDPQAILL